MLVLLRNVGNLFVDIQIVPNLRSVVIVSGIGIRDFDGDSRRLVAAEVSGTGVQERADRFVGGEELNELKKRKRRNFTAAVKPHDPAVESRGDFQGGQIPNVLNRNEEHSIVENEIDDDFWTWNRAGARLF